MDVAVNTVFTEDMWVELKSRIAKQGLPHLELVEELWRSDLGERSIITELLLDKDLGKKRLVSMPDRFTNTIQVVTRKSLPSAPNLDPVCRPTVINNYDG